MGRAKILAPHERGSRDVALPVDPLAHLLRKAKAGDGRALHRLFGRLEPRLTRAIRSALPADEDTEDCLQDTFVALMRALPAFRGDSTFAHYAVSIAIRCANAARRRRRARSELTARARSLEEPLVTPVPTPPEESLDSARRAALDRLVGELPASQADALVLRAVLDYSIGEVASHCGVPPNTVRSRMRLAREALRAKLDRDETLKELLDVRG